MPTNGSYEFVELEWNPCNIVYDENDPEVVVSFNWFITYVLVRGNYGTNTGPYIAEQSQLSAEPTRAEVETLILSLFAEGTAVAPETA